MTIGQFIESLSGKAACARGKPGDGTPFSNEGPDEVRKNLVKLGFSQTGSEVFYNGMTGENFRRRYICWCSLLPETSPHGRR